MKTEANWATLHGFFILNIEIRNLLNSREQGRLSSTYQIVIHNILRNLRGYRQQEPCFAFQ